MNRNKAYALVRYSQQEVLLCCPRCQAEFKAGNGVMRNDQQNKLYFQIGAVIMLFVGLPAFQSLAQNSQTMQLADSEFKGDLAAGKIQEVTI